MRYGFSLPVRGNLATHDGIAGIAQHGERLGFVSATIADHVVFPTSVESKYPYDASGNHPSTGDAIEPLSLMAFAAGGTSTLRFITSVLILPHRNPVLAAKMIASIDVLSQGRVTLGIGVGWLREEFQALGAADFDRRGAVSDEYLAIYKKLWSPRAGRTPWGILQFRAAEVRTPAGAASGSADLGGRPQQGRASPNGAPRRRLASDRYRRHGRTATERIHQVARRSEANDRGGEARLQRNHNRVRGATT